LITWVYEQPGYEISFGEAYRTPEQAALDARKGIGISHSLHTERLAIDLNLFIDGEFQVDSKAYEPMGVYWESLDSLAAWGGRFKDGQGRPKPDSDHFSIRFSGRA
jgi:hypothetical protein